MKKINKDKLASLLFCVGIVLILLFFGRRFGGDAEDSRQRELAIVAETERACSAEIEVLCHGDYEYYMGVIKSYLDGGDDAPEFDDAIDAWYCVRDFLDRFEEARAAIYNGEVEVEWSNIG